MTKRIRQRLALCYRILESHWAQPATALFRTFECEIVRRNLIASGRALDLGCGDGTLAEVLLGHSGSAEWCGADLELREVALATRNGPYKAVYAASAENLPEADATRDLVFSNSAIEHMADLEQTIKEISRILKPGGRLIFTVPSTSFHRCLFWPGVLARFSGKQRRARYLEALDRRLAHKHYLGSEQWRKTLAAVGLEVERAIPYLSPRVLGWWETLANLTGGLVHMLNRGRRSPRDVQMRFGIGGKPSRILGTLAFLALLPAILWTAAESEPDGDQRSLGCLYVEAVKTRSRLEEIC